MNRRSVSILLTLCLLGLLAIGAMVAFHTYTSKNAPPKRKYPVFTYAEDAEPTPEAPGPTPRKLAEVEARLAAPEEPQTEVRQDDNPWAGLEFIYSAPDPQPEPEPEPQPDPQPEPEPQPEPQPTTDQEAPPDQGNGDPNTQPDPNEDPNPTPTPDFDNTDTNSGGGEPTPNQEPGGGA